ncbi:MAG: DNA-directed RNA polymerase subunit beta' [Candidatus Portnoybacteria bacterium]|nr:DNA-directed RNA polymerase subunit beta' [Candidatus Portnoybacteria bacterium]
MSTVTDFKSIKLKIASPEEILAWSHGEVTKPETINYRTQRSEKDGLFCEKIFGPEKDWECYCGKYRRIRYKGIVCDKCGVEVTRSIVRRERMGHIELACPICHIWFLRGIPSKIGLILDISVQELEKVIYFANYIITSVNEEARQKVIEEIDREYKTKKSVYATRFKKSLAEKPLKEKADKNDKKDLSASTLENLRARRDEAIREVRGLYKLRILNELEYSDLSLKYGHVFEVGIGAEAVRKVLEEVVLEDLKTELQKMVVSGLETQKDKSSKRLKLVEAMLRARIRPEWMILKVLPVLPPDLRPMVALDGGRYASSDLNDLYRRVINRNNRLKKLIELNAPEVICRNEKRMLQEAVDALIDNSIRQKQSAVASTGQRRPLKSLADILKGKQGRFRQNLLGKRVDYSGRSVIVVGPELKIHQCGLPKRMALELFKPFVIQKLVERELAHNIRQAGRLIESEIDEVWAILEEVVKDRLVLLNRAPTLHRLGIQAFKPVLIEGSAIRLHPLVCRAFNADFDGDQMAVHLPLGEEAQKEASRIMLSSWNLLKPATGEPIAIPTQDMILGCYWMTRIVDGLKGEGRFFASNDEAIMAYRLDVVDLRARIKLRLNGKMVETCVGRIMFNEVMDGEVDFINEELDKKVLHRIIAQVIAGCGIIKAAYVLDRIKEIGFEYATKSGISWGMDDLIVPVNKKQILEEAEKEVEMTHKHYLNGLLTRDERRVRIIEIWFSVMDKISKEVRQSLSPTNPVFMAVNSGSRGSWGQTTQMVGIKGLVTNPAGEIIELPVKSSFKEGFNVLEYFISTHGARKGASDTALRTSTAGYLTRRLIDVAQDLIITEEDCGDKSGIVVYKIDGEELGRDLSLRITGRVSLEEIKTKQKVLVKCGQIIDKETAKEIEAAGIKQIRLRSVVGCGMKRGICQKCYGYDLGNNQLVKLGEAVGIVTAQAIGEPGTQLTMRTFHTGGVAGGGDITQGLPRVDEIFEVRPPKGRALISEVEGKVLSVETKENKKIITIRGMTGKSSKERPGIVEYSVSLDRGIWVVKDDKVLSGQQLTEGHIDLRDLFRLAGKETVQRYIIKEVQNIYTSQGEGINDKYIEIIIRQMFSRVKVLDAGDTNLIAGEIIERGYFLEENEVVSKRGGRPAKVQDLIMGISRVSLSTTSWLSAASFQETAKVLIDAAVQGKEDKLKGLKENVIIGKLIPAGTGLKQDFA